MLNDDISELFKLLSEEEKVKEKIKFIRELLIYNKENQEEVKSQIIHGLNEINHKYVEYKNMTVTLVKKPEKQKLTKMEIESQIENIIDDSSIKSSAEKKTKILEILRPFETGTTRDVLVIKFKKNKEKKQQE